MNERVRYKFEGFKVGDIIKSYDFKPGGNDPGLYVIGEIEEINVMYQGAICYRIRVTEDTAAPKGAREIVMVPYETMLLEFNERVTLVEEAR